MGGNYVRFSREMEGMRSRHSCSVDWIRA